MVLTNAEPEDLGPSRLLKAFELHAELGLAVLTGEKEDYWQMSGKFCEAQRRE